MKRTFHSVVFICLALTLLGPASALEAPPAQPPQTTEETKPVTPGDRLEGTKTSAAGERSGTTLTCDANYAVAWIVMALMALFYIFTLKTVLQLITSGGWKLSEALSEEKAEPPAAGGAAAGTTAPTQMVASSSRFIALIGSIVLVGLFLASSFYVVWALFVCQPLDRLDDLGTYLLSGAAIFAPYAVNKLSEIFKIK
jgi:hypothetical protein